MKKRKWITLYFTVVLVGVLTWMGVNYVVDPSFYFSIVENRTDEVLQMYNARLYKALYLERHKDKYEGVIITGSKGGAIDPEQLENYTGTDFYNAWINTGSFADYRAFTEFYCKNTNVKHIMLALSSFDVNQYSAEDVNEAYKIPALLKGTSTELEYAKNLFANLQSSFLFLGKEVTNRNEMPYGENGAREHNFDNSLGNGHRYFYDDSDEYIRNMLERDDKGFSYEQRLNQLFHKTPNTSAKHQNIEALKEIKKICESNGVELTLVITPVFLGARYEFECEEYYEYLAEISQITDFWDFSGFSDINRNPYNYIDYHHFTDEVTDVMIDTMYGHPTYDDFGVYVTQDNFDEYIEKRRSDFAEVRQEYERTGTVQLLGMDDDSYIECFPEGE